MMSSNVYEKAFLSWRPMDAYWPGNYPLQTEGPYVLFAWRLSQVADKWEYGYGFGTWPLRGVDDESVPRYWVVGLDVEPECFAYITPPKRKGAKR